MSKALTHGTGHEYALYQNTLDNSLVIVGGGEDRHFAFERELQSACGYPAKLRDSGNSVLDLQITASLILLNEQGYQ